MVLLGDGRRDMGPAKGNVVCAGRAHILRRAAEKGGREELEGGTRGREGGGDFDATDERDSDGGGGMHVCWNTSGSICSAGSDPRGLEPKMGLIFEITHLFLDGAFTNGMRKFYFQW